MNKAEELISEVASLPIKIRLQIIDRLLRSLNPTRKEIDEMWVLESEKRVEEIESGKVKTVSGDEVFRKVRSKRSK